MILIGLVLLIAAGAFGLDLIWKNHYSIRSPALFGQTLGIHSAAVLFSAGAVVGAAMIVGAALILVGLRRKGTQARQARRDRKEAKNADRDQARQKNRKLRDRPDRDDTGSSIDGATAAD